ncbi:centrosomal protein of 57 kDa isoform X2 [Synchiropus splendidus]|uniref:centrosomal protein of 57 kDa isoform X2 n=1 Tax=Synchiropus splendidus TaxID=270530 RepID=UPI00237D7CC8|nr:centrosomal protein of 57 kDa isoform X2 [Synchiropus splendidus]
MEKLPKTSAADATRRKEPRPAPSGAVSDTVSLPSYKEYPALRPFIHTHVTHALNPHRPASPIKGCPETSSAAILSALNNLQEKITKLEFEKAQGDSQVGPFKQDPSDALVRGDGASRQELQPHADSSHALLTNLVAAEARCVKLERQLEHMRKMLRNVKSDSSSHLRQQVARATPAQQRLDPVAEQAHSEKLERLEKECHKLTLNQKQAQTKIHALEMKLQEEEHQRKLVLDKTKELQSGLETNRLLFKSVSPAQPQVKKSLSQKSPPRLTSSVQPHYRLSLRDVPFIAGTSVSKSHSVAANVQSVLSLLKRHQPHLCNDRVLSPNGHAVDGSSSSSSVGDEELSELLRALQEELRLMSIEQRELARQLELSVSLQETNDLHHQQERLQLKMDQKGEQISKLIQHKRQLKKMRKEMNSAGGCRPESRASAGRGRPAGASKPNPGDRSKRNLRLLRDMRALQKSLRT